MPANNKDSAQMTWIDFVVPVLKNKTFFFGIIFLCITLAILYALLARQVYRSSATIMVIEEQQSGLSSMMAGSGLMGLVGGGGKSSVDTLATILNSRTMAQNVLSKHRQEILADLFPRDWDEKGNKWKISENKIPKEENLVNKLRESVIIQKGSVDKSLIDMSALFSNPALASKVLQTYIDELESLLDKKDLTVAQRQKSFLEQQLVENNRQFLESSKQISQFYQYFNVSEKNQTVSVSVDDNLKVVPQDADQTTKHTIKDLPANLYLVFLNDKQRVMETSNANLEAQYIGAKIEAERKKMSFYVIDSPDTPEKRYKPRRRQIVMVATMASVFLALAGCSIKESWKKSCNQIREKIREAM